MSIILFKINRDINKLLDEKKLNVNTVSKLVSITDLSNLNNIFSEHKPDQVFHAAIYKHVSLVQKIQLNH